MKEKEKELFRALCKFKNISIDDDLTDYASPVVLGHLFFNRMQGIAYGTLKDSGLLGRTNREFRNSLKAAYEHNIQKNNSFMTCVKNLCDILRISECPVAMLKGAYLCAHYPKGYRTSNDVDLLISPNDVTKIGNILLNSGFKQGDVKNGEFIPATRKEIIESKMMRGETVPYIKEVNLPYMRFFEVDINFSLDYKNSDDTVLSEMLENACTKKEIDISIPTLSNADFFIHLCAHLYKEATTVPWIKMNRDMTMYKYCDIYLLLSEKSNKDLDEIFERAAKFNMEKVCAYAILETVDLFDMKDTYAYIKSRAVIADEPDFCLKVVAPTEKRMYIYQTENTTERFFTENRINNLKEIQNEQTGNAKK